MVGHDVIGNAHRSCTCLADGGPLSSTRLVAARVLASPGTDHHRPVGTPATGQARHMIDNLGAAMGRLPDEAMRRRMIDHAAKL